MNRETTKIYLYLVVLITKIIIIIYNTLINNGKPT